MVISLFEGNFTQRVKTIAHNPLAWLLPAFFLLHLISVVYSDNTSNAWTNVDKKLSFFLAPLIIVSATPFTKEEIRRLMWVFVGACVVGSIFCLVNVVMMPKGDGWNMGPIAPYLELHSGASKLWPYFSYIHLSSGIEIHPTYFALYLFISFLIVLKTIDNRFISAALVVYLLIFIVMLSSRIVVIATALTLLAAASQRKILIAGVTVMILVILINPISLYRNTQEYTYSNFSIPPAAYNDNPISIRTSLLWLGAKAVAEINLVIGTGAGDVEDTITTLADKYDVHNILNTSDPHNQYLHTFIALGAIGLLLLLAVFAAPLLLLVQQREFLACAGLIAFMVVCLTESALELQKGIVLFSLFVGLTGNQIREWRFTTQRLKYA